MDPWRKRKKVCRSRKFVAEKMPFDLISLLLLLPHLHFYEKKSTEETDRQRKRCISIRENLWEMSHNCQWTDSVICAVKWDRNCTYVKLFSGFTYLGTNGQRNSTWCEYYVIDIVHFNTILTYCSSANDNIFTFSLFFGCFLQLPSMPVLFFLNGPMPASFLMFIFVFSKWYNSNLNWKKLRWCAWDSNPGRQDGRRRQIHWAMAAPQ